MHEGDSGVVSAGSWGLIDQLGALFEIGFDFLLDIIHLEADVVNAGTFRLQEFCERRVRSGGLDKFNVGLPNLEEPDSCFLGFDDFNSRQVEPKNVLIEMGSLFEII